MLGPMSDVDLVKITYDGRDFWLDAVEEADRTVRELEEAAKAGGIVWISHQTGRVAISPSTGALTIEYLSPIEALDVDNEAPDYFDNMPGMPN